MKTRSAEETISYLLGFGLPAVTIFLLTDSVTDPVNATKYWLAGGLAFALFSVVLVFGFNELVKNYKLFFIITTLFIFTSLSSAILSKSALSQNLYGVYGRNTGFFAYLFLSLIMISVLVIRKIDLIGKIILGLVIAGSINVAYCAWVLLFGDFISWNNPYGNILGLFGNPNFIGAFLGIFGSVLFIMALQQDKNIKMKIFLYACILLIFIEIKESHAVQGLVVLSSGFAISIFYFIKSRVQSYYILITYTFSIVVIAALSLLGALQKGPFDFIYKRSVSLRGSYWHAGIEMGLQNPLTGVGMDSYGDWYRKTRSLEAATNTPGLATVTNAAHNVIIDFFAYGGFPLLLTYLLLIFSGLYAIIRVTIRQKEFEPIFVSSVVIWSCYQLQSVISINQIGLALWGWVFTGVLIAYERITRVQVSESNKVKSKNLKRENQFVSPALISFIGLVLGLLIAAPPFSSDIKWRAALESNDAGRILKSLDSSYFNPVNSQRYAQAIQLFANSNLQKEAHDIALKAVAFNPLSYDAWRFLYFLSNSSPIEKEKAVIELQKLDPRNPDVTQP